jgi:hypothetical protein
MASRLPVHIRLWLTLVVDKAIILLSSRVSDPMNITRVLKGQPSAIPTAKYDDARTLIADTIDKLGIIVNGIDSAPSCLLVQNYKNDQDKKKSPHATAKGGVRKAYLDSTPGEPQANKKPHINKGAGDYFPYNKGGKMPPPTELEVGEQVCLMHAKKGLICSNPHCSMIISPPNKWPKLVLHPWLKLIKAMDGLAFNPDMVPGDIVMKPLNVPTKK